MIFLQELYGLHNNIIKIQRIIFAHFLFIQGIQLHADILLHVVDSASTVREEQMASVATVLGQIGADEIPQIVVYNKCDLSGLEPAVQRRPDGTVRSVTVSAVTGAGIELLREVLAQEAERVREENASVPRELEFWEEEKRDVKSDDDALKELEALL